MRQHVQLALAGLTLVVVWAVATTVGPFSDTTVNDIYVYRTYADLLASGQLPYLDFGFSTRRWQRSRCGWPGCRGPTSRRTRRRSPC